MGLSKYIPDTGKSELPKGVHECTITDCHVLKDNGIPEIVRGEQCIVVAFTRDGKTMERIFRLGEVSDKSLFIKMLAVLKIPSDRFLNHEIIGKKITVFIQKVNLVQDGTHGFRIKNFKPAGKSYPFSEMEVNE